MAFMKNFKVIAKDDQDNLTVEYTTQNILTMPFPTDSAGVKLAGNELLQALAAKVGAAVVKAEAPILAVSVDPDLDDSLGIGTTLGE